MAAAPPYSGLYGPQRYRPTRLRAAARNWRRNHRPASLPPVDPSSAARRTALPLLHRASAFLWPLALLRQVRPQQLRAGGRRSSSPPTSNEAKHTPKTIRSLRHSFQSCTALPGFSQVQSEPSRKLDQCDKQSHLDLSIPFQAQFKQFYQF